VRVRVRVRVNEGEGVFYLLTITSCFSLRHSSYHLPVLIFLCSKLRMCIQETPMLVFNWGKYSKYPSTVFCKTSSWRYGARFLPPPSSLLHPPPYSLLSLCSLSPPQKAKIKLRTSTWHAFHSSPMARRATSYTKRSTASPFRRASTALSRFTTRTRTPTSIASSLMGGRCMIPSRSIYYIRF
jgi:hypothetical protein